MTDEAAWTRFEARSEDFYEMKRRLEELTPSSPCAPRSKTVTAQNQGPGVPHSIFRCPDESDTTPESRVGSPRTPPCSLPSPDFYNLGAESSSDSSSPPSEAGSAIPGSDLAHAIDLEADSVLLGAGPTSGLLSTGDRQEQADLEAALAASLAESEAIAHSDETEVGIADSSIAPEEFGGSRSLQSASFRPGPNVSDPTLKAVTRGSARSSDVQASIAPLEYTRLLRGNPSDELVAKNPKLREFMRHRGCCVVSEIALDEGGPFGLVAARPIMAGTPLEGYGGVAVSHAPNGSHVYRVGVSQHGIAIDGSAYHTLPLGFRAAATNSATANDPCINATMEELRIDFNSLSVFQHFPVLVAKRNIPEGEEIVWSYPVRDGPATISTAFDDCEGLSELRVSLGSAALATRPPRESRFTWVTVVEALQAQVPDLYATTRTIIQRDPPNTTAYAAQRTPYPATGRIQDSLTASLIDSITLMAKLQDKRQFRLLLVGFTGIMAAALVAGAVRGYFNAGLYVELIVQDDDEALRSRAALAKAMAAMSMCYDDMLGPAAAYYSKLNVFDATELTEDRRLPVSAVVRTAAVSELGRAGVSSDEFDLVVASGAYCGRPEVSHLQAVATRSLCMQQATWAAQPHRAPITAQVAGNYVVRDLRRFRQFTQPTVATVGADQHPQGPVDWPSVSAPEANRLEAGAPGSLLYLRPDGWKAVGLGAGFAQAGLAPGVRVAVFEVDLWRFATLSPSRSGRASVLAIVYDDPRFGESTLRDGALEFYILMLQPAPSSASSESGAPDGPSESARLTSQSSLADQRQSYWAPSSGQGEPSRKRAASSDPSIDSGDSPAAVDGDMDVRALDEAVEADIEFGDKYDAAMRAVGCGHSMGHCPGRSLQGRDYPGCPPGGRKLGGDPEDPSTNSRPKTRHSSSTLETLEEVSSDSRASTTEDEDESRLPRQSESDEQVSELSGIVHDPEESKPFYLDVDAATVGGVGAALSQRDDPDDLESHAPLAFYSRRFERAASDGLHVGRELEPRELVDEAVNHLAHLREADELANLPGLVIAEALVERRTGLRGGSRDSRAQARGASRDNNRRRDNYKEDPEYDTDNISNECNVCMEPLHEWQKFACCGYRMHADITKNCCQCDANKGADDPYQAPSALLARTRIQGKVLRSSQQLAINNPGPKCSGCSQPSALDSSPTKTLKVVWANPCVRMAAPAQLEGQAKESQFAGMLVSSSERGSPRLLLKLASRRSKNLLPILD